MNELIERRRGRLLDAKVTACSRVRVGDVSQIYGKVIAVTHFPPFSSRRLEIEFEGGRKIVRGFEESITLLVPEGKP